MYSVSAIYNVKCIMQHVKTSLFVLIFRVCFIRRSDVVDLSLRRRRQVQPAPIYLQNTELYTQLTPAIFGSASYYDFEIGDNKTISGIRNKPLIPGTGYVYNHHYCFVLAVT